MLDCDVHGRYWRKLPLSALPAAALQRGVEVDLLDEVAGWQVDDFWRYGTYTAVMCLRRAAGRAGLAIRGLWRYRRGSAPQRQHDLPEGS